ncbi:MAG TPA: DapH/DapD/GlmU-related protein [Thermoanaerobaculia bacterium]|nr:DapH/DapD/GlmU-related protein [Thermoanaerobaculia bacterium]
MNLGTLVRRFLTPGFVNTLRGYLKYGCLISPKAEVEITSHLTIGRKSVVSSFTKIKATDGPLKIGRHVEISNGCVLTSHTGGVEIGDDCLIGPNVSIIGNNYRYDRLDLPLRLQEKISPKGIRVGNNVWIGAGCVLLDGADIGSGTILTPNSVVSGKLPENSIAQGNPAKVIFTRR